MRIGFSTTFHFLFRSTWVSLGLCTETLPVAMSWCVPTSNSKCLTLDWLGRMTATLRQQKGSFRCDGWPLSQSRNAPSQQRVMCEKGHLLNVHDWLHNYINVAVQNIYMIHVKLVVKAWVATKVISWQFLSETLARSNHKENQKL